MDVLTDVLEAARLKSGLYGRLELTAPWGLRFDCVDQHSYLVARGCAGSKWRGVDSPIQLDGGDLVLLPKGRPHTLKDAPARPRSPSLDRRGAGGVSPDVGVAE